MSDEKPETLESIAERIASLGKSIDERFAQVHERFAEIEKRFAEVDETFVEQRRGAEFAFGRLRSDLVSGFARVERRLP
jgi:hypothetical protein